MRFLKKQNDKAVTIVVDQTELFDLFREEAILQLVLAAEKVVASIDDSDYDEIISDLKDKIDLFRGSYKATNESVN